jgi:hypothetical protein
MAKQKNNQAPAVQEIDVGNALLSWESWDRPPMERSKTWYAIAGTIGVLLIAWSIWQENYLFAIIVVMTAVILLFGQLIPPNRISVHITDLGVVYGDTFYPFEDLRDFSIVYKPPVKTLYISFYKSIRPMIAVPIEDADPNALREALLPYVFENLEREEELLTDTIRRVYKL